MQIKSWDQCVLWEGEAATVKDAVRAAVKVGASLVGANLGGANLVGASLGGANLARASLDGANLARASLDWANLARASLVGASLDGASLDGANLDGANLARASLVRANLGGANLARASLVWANLARASLVRANLVRANLGGANLVGAKLSTGETWDEYLTQVLPALLTAGGKSLEGFEAPWQCHAWENCPMHHAFDACAISSVPILLRPRAEQFIQFFDQELIPWPLPTSEATEPETT